VANIAALDLLMNDYSAVCEESHNQKVLGIFTATSLDLLSKKPVRTMEDWKGLLVQSIAPACAATIEALGGSPVSIPWPDAYTSLDKGVVDAGMYATNQMVIYKMYEVADYVVPVYMVPTAMIATINLDVWNSLPKDIQDLLLEEHMKTAKILNDIFVPLCDEHLVTLPKHGVEVISLPEAERARWRDALAPFRESSLAELGDFGKRIQEVADQVNAQYPYQTYGK
jgi:TRAP-type C4-dicarboxylate transport system substrate-binding protein